MMNTTIVRMTARDLTAMAWRHQFKNAARLCVALTRRGITVIVLKDDGSYYKCYRPQAA